MAGCKMKKGGSVKSGAGVAPQAPASFAPPKVTNGFKKGGAVKAPEMKKKPADKNAGMVKSAAKPSMKKVDKAPVVDETKSHFNNVKVTKSYASSGAAVKKLPLKLKAGGAAKQRAGYPMTLPIPKGKK